LGMSPQAPLSAPLDGVFYGATYYGGTSNSGTLFKITTNGLITTLYSFSGGNDGGNPFGGLVLASDHNFYGTTVYGGTNGFGTCFKLAGDGTFTPLYSFTGNADGGNPYAGLTQGKDGNLYGTTYNGGQGYGTVFRITIQGAITPFYSFTGNTSDGANPSGKLVQGSDGNFYGTTQSGGLSGFGTIFQLLPASGMVNIEYQFTGGYDGATPYTGLVQAPDGLLYGTTTSGGTNGYDGTVFACTTDGNLTPLWSFTGFPDGSDPEGDLVLGTDGNLYGTTDFGSTNGFGSVFRITTNGVLTTLYAFAQDFVNGANPTAGLVQTADGKLYGTTYNGGVLFTNGLLYLGSGSVFGITTNGLLNTLYLFNNTTGAVGGLVLGADGNFYGTTVGGGSNNDGTVFSVSPNGMLTNLFSFSHTNGANPTASLLQGSDGNFYGVASSGGAYSAGTLFQMTTNDVVSTLLDFPGATNGYGPLAALAQGLNGTLYGALAFGGEGDNGAIFAATTNGVVNTLHRFILFDGSFPIAGLVAGKDGSFYGTTLEGTDFFEGFGTIFNITANGTLSTLVAFDGTNGANPAAVLTQGDDGNFYGTTVLGGTNNYGAIFEVTTNGNLTSLYSFGTITNDSGVALDGANPVARMVQGPDGNFYGTTASGGAFNMGTAFQVTKTGVLNTLYSFTGSGDGATPVAGLVLGADGSFYGTTTYGTTNNNGTFFRLTVPMPPSLRTIQHTASTLSFTWTAVAASQYQVQFSTNLLQNSWNNLGGAITATNGTGTFSDTLGPDRQRFYRVVLLP
jgi:uncharacterized repeat protein (TIGR03803 family)